MEIQGTTGLMARFGRWDEGRMQCRGFGPVKSSRPGWLVQGSQCDLATLAVGGAVIRGFYQGERSGAEAPVPPVSRMPDERRIAERSGSAGPGWHGGGRRIGGRRQSPKRPGSRTRRSPGPEGSGARLSDAHDPVLWWD